MNQSAKNTINNATAWKYTALSLVVFCSIASCKAELKPKVTARSPNTNNQPAAVDETPSVAGEKPGPPSPSSSPAAADFSLRVPGSAYVAEPIQVEWNPSEAASKYDMTVSSDAECSNPIFVLRNIQGSGQEISIQAPGSYFICVTAKDHNGTELFKASSKSPVVILAKLQATLTGAPQALTNMGALAITVGGAGISKYRFKLGVAASTACSDAAGYSAEAGISAVLNQSLSSLADGLLRLCVIGGNSTGAWQDPSAASVVEWTSDRLAPAVSLTGVPTAVTVANILNVSITGSDLNQYRYALLTGAPDCSGALFGAWKGAADLITDSVASPGSYRLCVEGTDTAGNSAIASAAFRRDSPPSITALEPTGSNDEIALNASFNLTWTDADSDDDAAISLYFKSTAAGACNTGTLITSALFEDADGAGDSYLWDTTGVPAGNYSICGRIDDGLQASESWSASYLHVNSPPAIAFTFGTYVEIAGTSIALSFNDSDSDNDAQISLYYKTTNSGACNTGTLIASGLSEDAVSSHSWNTTAIASGLYYFCGRITDGVNPAVESWAANSVTVFRNCLWSWGGGALSWNLSGNWSGCGGISPATTDRVVVPSGANQPILTANATIHSFGNFAAGGGTLTITAGTSLTLTSTSSSQSALRSSIGFNGDTTTCTTCIVYGSGAVYVTDGATLTLGKGIRLHVNDNMSNLYIGTTLTPGHLVTTGGATQAEMPVIRNKNAVSWDRWGGILVRGVSAGQRSTVSINGLRVDNSSGGTSFLTFNQYFDIVQFDNVEFGTITPTSANHARAQGGYIYLQDCVGSLSTGAFNTITFSGVNLFGDPVRATFSDLSGVNIHAGGTGCTSANGFGITVSGSGPSYGAALEKDPNNIITWINGDTYTCTWNGSVDTSWTNPSNWDNCANGRLGYPDQNDRVLIPVTPTQPVISGLKSIQNFVNTPGGGGTVTVNAASTLRLINFGQTFGSDVTLAGATPGCIDCTVQAFSAFTIFNNSSLILGKGITLQNSWYSSYTSRVGDGTTGGRLQTVPADASSANWPKIAPIGYTAGTFLTINGGAGSPARVKLEGIRFANVDPNYNFLVFQNNFEVETFDKVTFDVYGTNTMTKSYLTFTSCTSGTILDTLWDGIEFADGFNLVGNNIKFSGCAAAGPIQINPWNSGGNGWGDSWESDPDSRIIWN